MSKIIKIKNKKQTILIETTDIGKSDFQFASGKGKIEKNLDKILDVINPVSESISEKINSLGKNKPNSVTTEFGLSFTVEGNVFFVKASGQATLKISLQWNNL
ncbi:MAG: hypothetical protein KDD29_10400 [Flavobacteriales bacterium]|nr:hypothetical protein [Flavobacteriales bacterium]